MDHCLRFAFRPDQPYYRTLGIDSAGPILRTHRSETVLNFNSGSLGNWTVTLCSHLCSALLLQLQDMTAQHPSPSPPLSRRQSEAKLLHRA
jgi:hypothetical protein